MALSSDDVLNGAMRTGHPLLLDGEEVWFRSARYSPHAEEVLVVVATLPGGFIAVTPAELSRLDPEGV